MVRAEHSSSQALDQCLVSSNALGLSEGNLGLDSARSSRGTAPSMGLPLVALGTQQKKSSNPSQW